MNHFPFMAPVEESIINGISNLSKATFSSAMPFVYFTAHGASGNGETIGVQETDYAYSNKGSERFPPLITNLEVKPTGTMGVVREGSVTVKFASMRQLSSAKYQNFFRIGTAKTITWGWNQNRLNGKNSLGGPVTPTAANSAEIAGDINKWRSWLADRNYSADILVGPLINFSFTLNNDASVDVVFTVGSPNELVAYMGSHKTDAESTKASDENNIANYRVAQLLNLVEANFVGGATSEFEKNIHPELLNYNFSQSTFQQMWANITSFFSSGEASNSLTEDVYVTFNAIVKYVINQNPPPPKTGTIQYKFDIDEAISVAHPRMISNSENVIFCNGEMANPRVIGNEIRLDTVNTQAFDSRLPPASVGVKQGHSYPEKNAFTPIVKNSSGANANVSTLQPFHWGYVKHAFFKISFVQDIVKNNGDGNVVDIVEKLCNELNIATCGLTDLAPQEASNSDGKPIFTVVDYNLVGSITTGSIQTLPLFEAPTSSSTIINVSFNCDLPKEIAAMTMLGNRKGNDVGKNLFFAHIQDNVLKAEKVDDYKQPPTPAVGGTPPVVKIDESCVFMKVDPVEQFSGANNKERTKVVFKNTDMLKAMYFGSGSGYDTNNPLLPIELEITVLGISGIIAGQVLMINKGSLPFDNNGIFQVKEVNHTVSDTWETTIKLGFRPDNK